MAAGWNNHEEEEEAPMAAAAAAAAGRTTSTVHVHGANSSTALNFDAAFLTTFWLRVVLDGGAAGARRFEY